MAQAKEILIKTPLGVKKWSYIKRCIDIHQELMVWLRYESRVGVGIVPEEDWKEPSPEYPPHYMHSLKSILEDLERAKQEASKKGIAISELTNLAMYPQCYTKKKREDLIEKIYNELYPWTPKGFQ